MPGMLPGSLTADCDMHAGIGQPAGQPNRYEAPGARGLGSVEHAGRLFSPGPTVLARRVCLNQEDVEARERCCTNPRQTP